MWGRGEINHISVLFSCVKTNMNGAYIILSITRRLWKRLGNNMDKSLSLKCYNWKEVKIWHNGKLLIFSNVSFFSQYFQSRHLHLRQNESAWVRNDNSVTAEFHKVDSSMLKIGTLHFSYNRKFVKCNVYVANNAYFKRYNSLRDVSPGSALFAKTFYCLCQRKS